MEKCPFCFSTGKCEYWCDIGGDNPNWTEPKEELK